MQNTQSRFDNPIECFSATLLSYLKTILLYSLPNTQDNLPQ